MSTPIVLSDRELQDDYLTTLARSGVDAIDSNNLLDLRDDGAVKLIKVFKAPSLIFSCRFLASTDSITFRLIYYKENSDSILEVAGQSATVTVAATANTISLLSPPQNIFLGNNVTIPMQGAKRAKIQVTAITGEADILAGVF